jgi:Haem-binding domain
VAPPEVEAILRNSCYDCHSNQTRWPWYSRVAPLSWVIVDHVEQGRKQINFSEWGDYFPRTRKRKLQWMQRALHDEVMPLWSYRLMHPGTRLNDADRATLDHWIDMQLAGPVTGSSPQ